MSVEFNEGDVVQLKSGGPDMTYIGDDEIGEAICIWFEKTLKRSATFAKIALKPKGASVSSIPLTRG